MGVVGMPPAEVAIDAALVKRLLRTQHPDLAELTVSFLSEGWDNVMFRVGPDVMVRLPRRQPAVVLIEHEQRWLPELAPRLPLPIPAPVRVGRGEHGYPWPWSVVRWVDGERASDAALADPPAEARRLGRFVQALHVDAPHDAPPNEVRGVPLAERDTITRDRLSELSSIVDVDAITEVWDAGLAAAPWNRPPRWLHGDLHAANIVVRDGEIVSIIDWGDITAGDPATDLAVAWMLFDAENRVIFRRDTGDADDDTWCRARAWGATLGLAYLAHSADNPAMGAIGRRLLDAVVE